MSLKVLHVYRTYFPETQGGLEEAIRQICLGTQALGVENRVLTTAWNPLPEVIERPEARIIRAKRQINPASCSIGLGAIRHYREQIAWADIVNLHYPWPYGDLLHLLLGNHCPTVITYHSDIVRQKIINKLYSPIRRILFRKADRIVATSDNYASSSHILRQYADKVVTIPLGLDAAEITEPSLDIDEKTQSTFGRDYFLFVGVLRYYKGLQFLVDAMKEAPYKLVIAGSGPFQSKLERQAKRNSLSNITFAGQVSDQTKYSLLKNCRGVVFPSHLRSEAFGITLVEGSLFGKPLISCEIGTGTSFVNAAGETGLVVKPRSAVALREAMDSLWHNPNLAKSMGEQSRTRYETLFSGAKLGESYADLYKEVVAARHCNH